ncbi:MAG TPA: DUF2254 family protein [Azospirillum sp.]|nr:DUF2254 family protein [Azospirillum sp.]
MAQRVRRHPVQPGPLADAGPLKPEVVSSTSNAFHRHWGKVFSIIIVALSLAANQFGTRLVRTYMADIRTKLALGLFTMTVMYCLLALRSVEKDMPAAEIPHVTVTVGLVLGLTCVLVLLFFLHRVARSIVADEVIRRVAGELEERIERMPPLQASRPADRRRRAPRSRRTP